MRKAELYYTSCTEDEDERKEADELKKRGLTDGRCVGGWNSLGEDES